MIVLIAALAGPALASGVLYGEAGLAPLESLALEARVTGRVAEVTATFRFDAAPGAWTFAASLPADAAVAGLRLQAGEGEWIEASASAAPADGDGDSAEDGAAPEGLPGAVFTAALPETDAAGVAVELRWQRLLAASGGALTLEIPLDDGGLNPGDPPASLVAEVAALDPVLEAWLEGGEVAVDGDRIRAQWQGGLGDALALGWSEDAAELGVTLLSYRPEEDPFTGEAPGAGYALAVIRPGPVSSSSSPLCWTSPARWPARRWRRRRRRGGAGWRAWRRGTASTWCPTPPSPTPSCGGRRRRSPRPSARPGTLWRGSPRRASRIPRRR